MKSEIIIKKKYPCIMKNKISGIIVLFYADKKGIVLHNPYIFGETENFPIGYFCDKFNMADFCLFVGEIILSN